MEQITTICYGKKDTWQSREEAQAFFLKAMAGSEGNEQERYATIYTQLCLGNSLDDLSFIKRKEIFSYQNEYRYLIVDELEERKNIRFEIGDLKDLATIMSKSEFLKTL